VCDAHSRVTSYAYFLWAPESVIFVDGEPQCGRLSGLIGLYCRVEKVNRARHFFKTADIGVETDGIFYKVCTVA
jgi:hypothetical protein